MQTLHLIVCFALSFVLYGGFTSARELSGPNVCTDYVWTTEYVYRNESYPCLRRVYFPPEECSYRYRRADRGCYRNVYNECWETVRYCDRVQKKQYRCCEGYEEDGQGGCQVSIMCTENNGGCDQACVSEGNDMKCACHAGYVMDSRQTCKDIDECSMRNGGCDQFCHNTVGSYYCSCKNGYRLTDHQTCTEIDECSMGNGMCEHHCHNVPGAHYCTCEPGFLLVNGFMCEDHEECADPTYNHGCVLCVNDFGSYHCECPEGSLLAKDNKTCIAPDYPDDGPGEDPDFYPNDEIPDTVTERVFAVNPERDCPSHPVGAIVGGVLGGCVLICIILLLLFCLYRHGCCDRCLPTRNLSPPSAAPNAENLYDDIGNPVHSGAAFDNHMYGSGGGGGGGVVVIGGSAKKPVIATKPSVPPKPNNKYENVDPGVKTLVGHYDKMLNGQEGAYDNQVVYAGEKQGPPMGANPYDNV